MKSAAEKIQVITGDCTIVLDTLKENSIDSCVTDPPYHLNFMGKQWDGGDIAFLPETWAKVYRVLKPGAHLLAFGGTRTYHRLACAIEDAGFEIRDCIQWLYGSGFPKSHDVSKGIDRVKGKDGTYGDFKSAGHDRTWKKESRHEGWARPWMDDAGANDRYARRYIGGSDEAQQWQGWGTALKPAAEMIVMARKPLSESTIAANVLKWGTGALNIDRCRIPSEPISTIQGGKKINANNYGNTEGNGEDRGNTRFENTQGRWPANVIHDGSEEVVEGFPESMSSGGKGEASQRTALAGHVYGDYSGETLGKNAGGLGDEGSAARFFYTPKADSFDRIGSKHPTVKPLDLMQYLVRLVTQKGGTVLDPFAGTGTTGEAAFREGMRAVLIERDEAYLSDINRRIALCLSGPEEKAREIIKEKMKGKPLDSGPLFSDWR